jgi:hypothetical protein
MIKILPILVLGLFSLQCSSDRTTFRAYYCYGGRQTAIPTGRFDRAMFERMARDLFEGTSERLAIRADAALVDSIEHQDSVLEIVFLDRTTLHTRVAGDCPAQRLLIPLSGRFAGRGPDSGATLLIAGGGDTGMVLRNPEGVQEVQRLCAMADQALLGEKQ